MSLSLLALFPLTAPEKNRRQEVLTALCFTPPLARSTGFLSEIGTKLRDWAVGQAGGSCYSWAALSSNDSKTL